MLIPRCPKCGDCKILLAPITGKTGQTRYDIKTTGDIPIACQICDWEGDWNAIAYLT